MYTGHQQSGEITLSEQPPFGGGFLTKEWPFLRACVAPSTDSESLRSEIPPGLDWNLLLDLAERHAVQLLLAKRLQEIGFENIPPGARERLQERLRAQHLFALSLMVELFRVLDDFSRDGIQTIVIKGPVTALVAHGDASSRSFGDIDLLLQQKDIAAASRRIQQQGFVATVPDEAIRAGNIPGEYVFRLPGTRRMIEIHTERTFRYYPNGMPIDGMFRRKRELLMDGRGIPALSLADEVVFHCVHGAKDFWERLLWVADVAGFVEKRPELPWSEILQIAAESGSSRMLHVGVLLAGHVLGTRMPAAIHPQVEADAAVERLCRQIEMWLPSSGGAPASIRQRALYRMHMAGGGVAGVKYLSRLSLSPTQEDWERGALRRRSRFWDALRRPLRLMRKYGPGD